MRPEDMDDDAMRRLGGMTDPRPTWVQRDGTPIAIEDMTDSHLQNSIAMLERGAVAGLEREEIGAWAAAASFDPDSMASYYADQAAYSLSEMAPDDWLSEFTPYDALVAERDRRIAAGTWEPTFKPSGSLVERWLAGRTHG